MGKPYVVRPGDTWSRIARRFGVTVDRLVEVNIKTGKEEGGYLLPGEVLHVPTEECPEERENADSRLNAAIAQPYGYCELKEDLQVMMKKFPFVQIEWIGRSVMGRSIPALRIGMGRREVHANGACHANEWITSPVLMRFAAEYAAACTGSDYWNGYRVRELYERTSLWIVPMVNPDGVELVHCGVWPSHPFYCDLLEWNGGCSDFSGWKANIRGVDLNDQYPAHWEEERERRGVPGPGPRDFTGAAPLTEPEAASLAAFTRRRNFRMVLAFHTQGEEIYWNYRDLEPPDSDRIAARLGRVSGYRPVKLSGSDAGYKDWFIQQYRRPGFTVEAGLGTNPLPVGQLDAIYGQSSRLLLETLLLTAVMR